MLNLRIAFTIQVVSCSLNKIDDHVKNKAYFDSGWVDNTLELTRMSLLVDWFLPETGRLFWQE